MSIPVHESEDVPRRSVSHPEQRLVDSTAPREHGQTPVTSLRAFTNSEPEATPPNRTAAATTSSHPLVEFRSLLEAAERIARAPIVGTGDGQWTEENPQPDPVIRLLQPRQRGNIRRVPFTRTYSGRPHIPGEDSGSDNEEEDSRMDIDTNTNLVDVQPLQDAPQTNTSTTPPSSAELVRRDMLEPDVAVQTSDLRARSNSTGSVRRWRPAERLQDYASSHVRRDSGQTTTDTNRIHTDVDINPASQTTWLDTRMRARRAVLRPEPAQDSDEAVDRATVAGRDLERALQDYRIARRILRPHIGFGDDTTGNETENRLTTASTAPVRNRSSTIRGARNNVNSIHEFINSDRGDETTNRDGLPHSNRRRHGDNETIGNGDASSAESHALYIRTRLNDARYRANDRSATSEAADIYHTSRNERSAAALDFMSSYHNQSRIRRERQRRIMRHAEEDLPPLVTGPLFEGGVSAGDGNRDASYDLTPRPSGITSTRPGADASIARRRQVVLEEARKLQYRARSKEMKQAKATLEYLARLREDAYNLTKESAWNLATELGLHNQNLEHDSQTSLAMSVDELPVPAYSSWLEPGTTWKGHQSAEINTNPTSVQNQPVSEHHASDQRERVAYAVRQTEAFLARLREDRDRSDRAMMVRHHHALGAPASGISSRPGSSSHSSTNLTARDRVVRDLLTTDPADRELFARYLGPAEGGDVADRFLLDSTNRQHARPQARLNRLAEDSQPPQPRDRDLWNVEVVLHSVNWDEMTLTGTMKASHHQGTWGQAESTSSPNSAQYMESFFMGEIIDFRTHGLDMHRASLPQDKSSNLVHSHLSELDAGLRGRSFETDLIHWADLGPFQREVDHAYAVRQAEAQQEVRQRELAKSDGERRDYDHAEETGNHQPEEYGDSILGILNGVQLKSHGNFTGAAESDSLGVLSEDEKFDIKLRTMTRLLSDTNWLHQNINQEGWILMRWKEQCFVSPNPDLDPSEATTRTTTHDMSTPRPRQTNPHSTTNITNFITSAWPSSAISPTRRRDRIWTTVESERNEHQNSTGTGTGTRDQRQESAGSAWGLSISGFYYVALNRRTGEIEALYHDSGSLPFQRLNVKPVSHGNGADGLCQSGKDVGGLKTNFNLVEFR